LSSCDQKRMNSRSWPMPAFHGQFARLLGGALAVVGGIAATLLVREREIAREVVETTATTALGAAA
jgi:hypothetical protein